MSDIQALVERADKLRAEADKLRADTARALEELNKLGEVNHELRQPTA